MLSLSNIPRKEVSAEPKRNKPGHDISETSHARSSSKEGSSSRMHIRKRTALHATQCLPCTCTERGYHPLVDLIQSTLRRNLRSLSEVPSTLRRNLRSIAVSFFLPCEHNNRKADRIAFLNNVYTLQLQRYLGDQGTSTVKNSVTVVC